MTQESYWLIDIDGIDIDSEEIDIKDLKGIVDTGTSALVGDKALIKSILKNIPDIRPDCANLDKLPNVDIRIGGISYSLKPKDYIIELDIMGQKICENGWIGVNFPEKLKNIVILGDIFLKPYYTHFDYGKKRVGFATAV